MERKCKQLLANTLPLQTTINRQPTNAQNRHRVTWQLQLGRQFGGSHLSHTDRNKAGNDFLAICQGDIGFANALALLLPGLPGEKIVECSDAAVEASATGMAFQQFDAKRHLAPRHEVAQSLGRLRWLLAGCNEFFESLLRQAQRIVLGHYTASGFISVLQHE